MNTAHHDHPATPTPEPTPQPLSQTLSEPTVEPTPAVLDPERQFVGCLMWLPTTAARPLLAGMRATDVASPPAAFVLQLAIELAAAGRPAEPVALYTHAITTGRAIGEHQRGRLGKWLADTYHDAAHRAPLIADYLKAVVLETAWRRAVRAHATRLLHAVEDSTPDLVRDLTEDTTAADELWDRYHTAATAAGLEPDSGTPGGTHGGAGVAA